MIFIQIQAKTKKYFPPEFEFLSKILHFLPHFFEKNSTFFPKFGQKRKKIRKKKKTFFLALCLNLGGVLLSATLYFSKKKRFLFS